MGREQDDAGQFEWINAWAASTNAAPPASNLAEPKPAELKATELKATKPKADAPKPIPALARMAPALPGDQLMRDIAEIERVRDALAALPATSSKRNMRALTLVPARTTDPVPVVVGGVLALVMLTVFGAAAAMTKLSR